MKSANLWREMVKVKGFSHSSGVAKTQQISRENLTLHMGYPMKSFLGQWPTRYATGMTLATPNERLDSLGDYYVCNQ
jgi:hypothetical protein